MGTGGGFGEHYVTPCMPLGIDLGLMQHSAVVQNSSASSGDMRLITAEDAACVVRSDGDASASGPAGFLRQQTVRGGGGDCFRCCAGRRAARAPAVRPRR